MRKGIINIILFVSLAELLAIIGHTARTWQFWAIMIIAFFIGLNNLFNN